MCTDMSLGITREVEFIWHRAVSKYAAALRHWFASASRIGPRTAHRVFRIDL